MKRYHIVIALVFLAVAMMFLYIFFTQQKNTNVPTEDVSLLLPEITNYTVQNGVRYSSDSSPYHLMDVYLPVGNGPFPAILYIHGGGWARGSRTDYNTTAPFYAKRGIAGFSIDYTLTPKNGTAWPENIQDVVESIRFIRENARVYGIDIERLAVLGYSSGAQFASLAGTLSGNESFLAGSSGNEKIRSQVHLVVDYSGATDLDFVGKYEKMSVIYDALTNALGNVSYSMNPGLWVEVSPATYISSDDPIFCLIHGTNDTIVPIEVAESFNAKLRAAGVETHFIKVPNGDHHILTTPAENQIVRYSLEPLLKKVFNLNPPSTSEFQAPIISALILTVALIVATIFSRKHLFENQRTRQLKTRNL